MEKHNVTIESRNRVTITDVSGIDTFDEEEVCVQLSDGGLIIKGKDLHIQRLDLDQGEAEISGEIISVAYTKPRTAKKLFGKMRK